MYLCTVVLFTCMNPRLCYKIQTLHVDYGSASTPLRTFVRIFSLSTSPVSIAFPLTFSCFISPPSEVLVQARYPTAFLQRKLHPFRSARCFCRCPTVRRAATPCRLRNTERLTHLLADCQDLSFPFRLTAINGATGGPVDL